MRVHDEKGGPHDNSRYRPLMLLNRRETRRIVHLYGAGHRLLAKYPVTGGTALPIAP